MLKIIYSIYGFSLVSIVFLFLFSFLDKLKNIRILLVAEIICFGFFLGVANRWGFDSVHYYLPFFESNSYKNIEIGFTLISKILINFKFPGEYIPILYIVLSSICFFFNSYMIFKYKNDYGYKKIFLSVFIFSNMISFCFMYAGLLRQALALPILLSSMTCYIYRKNKTAIILILLSIAFHFSNIVFLFIPIWHKMKNNIKYILFSFGIILAFLSKYICDFMLYILPRGYFITDKITGVIEYSAYNEKHDLYIFKFILSLSVLLFFIFISRNQNQSKSDIFKNYGLYTFIIASVSFFSKEASIRYLFIENIILALWGIDIIYSNYLFSWRKKIIICTVSFFCFYGVFAHLWLSKIAIRFM